MKKTEILGLLATVLACAISVPARADRRIYLWTYQYQTVEAGGAEVESYMTLSTPDAAHSKGKMSTEHKVELEVGMNDRFDFAVYQVFMQPPGESLEYEGFSLRGRYRFLEKGEGVMDPLIYLEYSAAPDFAEQAIEGKLILAKDIGNLNLALNAIVEFEQERDETAWKFKPEYAVGVSYRLHELINIGLEAKGGKDGHYLGPVISHGRENLWVALGAAYKISPVEEGAPEFQARLLMGVRIK